MSGVVEKSGIGFLPNRVKMKESEKWSKEGDAASYPHRWDCPGGADRIARDQNGAAGATMPGYEL
jgi:hypothetical protein